MIALNFKAYAESAGENGLGLIKAAEAVSKKTSKKIILCPAFTQLHYASKYSSSNLWFFAQHADANDYGTFTGNITLEEIKSQGCGGTLLNHTEKKVSFEHARTVVEKSKKLGLKTMVCADTPEKGVLFAELRPWAVAVEIPELIATGISISRVRPEAVENAVEKIKSVDSRILVFAGAGVANAEDYAKALELGADGVLLSSRFVLAKNPREWLQTLADVKI